MFYLLTQSCVVFTCVCSPTFEQNMDDEPDLKDRLVTDKSLVKSARGYIVDLWVYDDHFATAKSIKVSILTLIIAFRLFYLLSICFEVWWKPMTIPPWFLFSANVFGYSCSTL